MDLSMEIQRFKMELFRKMPFYGDILMHLTFVDDKNVQIAATDGKTVWYNSAFLSNLSQGERNFILMHEVFHVLLRHGIRNADGKRNKEIWNTACDIIINDMLVRLQYYMTNVNIPFQKPSIGVFANIISSETAENLYEKILAENEKKGKKDKKLKIRFSYTGFDSISSKIREIEIPDDIRSIELSPDDIALNDQFVKDLIRDATKKNQGTMGSYYVPAEVYSLVDSKKLDWKKLLRNFLSQEISDDSSYTTPERKYLHMDMILPGHSLSDETVEEIWAFVDSSGSVNQNEINQFLTQLYRISHDFKCVFNICYWDTSVTDVYKKILSEKDIMKCVPRNSGGTNINCIYNWMSENKVKPNVMLILTDGYFGQLSTPKFNHNYAKKTILVLSSNIAVDDYIRKVGKIAKL